MSRKSHGAAEAIARTGDADLSPGEGDRASPPALLASLAVLPTRAYRAIRSGMDIKPADVTLASGFVVSCLQKHEVALVDLEVQSYFSRGLLRLNPGDTVFDVGANIGLFMLAAWERCERNLDVYAFEPVGAIFERLRVNVERCRAGSRLQAFDFGLSSRRDEVSFAYYPRAPVLSTGYPDEAADLEVMKAALLNNMIHLAEAPLAVRCLRWLPGFVRDPIVHAALARTLRPTTVRCRMETLSRFVSDHGIERIDLLKIDAEKAELEVFRGIEAMDWRKIRQVVVEVHDLGDRVGTMTALLREHGLGDIVVEQPPTLTDSNIYNVFATRG
jgi:FkbM family methyltransferase